MPAARGFTLVECAIACAVVGVLAAVALPSYQSQLRRAARADAVQALARLQAAQEAYRGHHGLYSAELSALRGVAPVTEGGHYALALEVTGPETYRAVARAQGDQARDTACAALTLDVRSGFATVGPSASCWNR